MKKVLFMLSSMNMGGTEKALLSMIDKIPKEKFDITILLLEEKGELLSYIPEWVKVKILNNYSVIKDMVHLPPRYLIGQYIKNRNYIRAINYSFNYFASKILKDLSIYFKYVLNRFPVMEEEFDLAVAYQGPMDFISYYVINKIRSKKKAAWIHFDIEKMGVNREFSRIIYKYFDRIFVVSKQAKDVFCNVFPDFKEKTELLLNIVPIDLIKHMAELNEGFNDKFDGIRLLTVGRISNQKGQDLIPPILSRLIKDGYNVNWYCIGGNEMCDYENPTQKILGLMKKYNVEKRMVLLGVKKNPYPYIKQCDIYIQPSRYEGYCTTTNEARILKKPIITTDVSGAREQIVNNETGLIVQIEENEIYLAIKRLLDNKNLSNKIINNLEKVETCTNGEMDKLYNLIY